MNDVLSPVQEAEQRCSDLRNKCEDAQSELNALTQESKEIKRFLKGVNLSTDPMLVAAKNARATVVEQAITQQSATLATTRQALLNAENEYSTMLYQIQSDNNRLLALADISHAYTSQLNIAGLVFEVSAALDRLRQLGETPEPFTLTISVP